jgi:hypothetical protein
MAIVDIIPGEWVFEIISLWSDISRVGVIECGEGTLCILKTKRFGHSLGSLFSLQFFPIWQT